MWSLFKKDTTYFGPGAPAFMLNYRVDDLDGLIAKLRTEGGSTVWSLFKKDTTHFGPSAPAPGHQR